MIRYYNSLTRLTEDFVPRDPQRVGLYTCGPTVHDFAHIGNFRTFAWEDVLRRHLEWRGYPVFHVMNITDIEDRIIAKAAEAGQDIRTFTQRFTEAFLEDGKALGMLPAHVFPRATDHVPEMIELIRSLEAKGHTYAADGSIYYRIDSFGAYGRLMGLKRDQLIAGARVDADEYQKDDPADFVLWKGQKPGEPAWDSPWGPGRPGWHIECSAMSIRYLGESFDLHTGGIDNKFPHHENEIAQSEGATGHPFVRYWLHAAHLVVDGEKMSKRLGNFHTLRDLLLKGHDPRYLRWVLTGTHYRKSLNFSFEALDGAKIELGRLDEMRARLAREVRESRGSGSTFAPRVEAAREAFGAAMDDDLNVSGATGEVFKFVREVNGALDRNELALEDVAEIEGLVRDVDRVLGLVIPTAAVSGPPAEVVELAEKRQAARKARDWAASDRLRDEIAALGWIVEDTAQGPNLKKK